MKRNGLAKVLGFVMAGIMLVGCGGGADGNAQPAAGTSTAPASGGGSGATKTIQLGHVNPSTDEDNLQHACLAFADKVSELSGGTIEVKVVGDSQLGTDREMIEGMQMGTVDMVLCMNSSLGAFVPEFQVFDLPFLFSNRDQVYGVLGDESIVGPLKEKLYTDAGIKMFGYMDNGFRHCLNNLKPINSLQDLSGMKIRLAENAIWSDCFKAYGASPTAMAFSEVYTACQQGTIDGFELPVASTFSGQYWEVIDYYSLTGHLFTALNLCMSAQTWEGFTEEEQAWLEEAADYAIEENHTYIQAKEEEWLNGIREHMEVNDCADKSGFVTESQKVYDSYKDEIGEDLLKQVMDAVAAIG
ncbi:MAG: TRAP transporter substrate-binding protein [Lachnospiraceae bacterium]|nr:TRAP transporter substrate-binding protein [Lachnospiraceae bacterium]